MSRKRIQVVGKVVDVANGTIGNGVTYYYYFDMGRLDYDTFSMKHDITATTLTYEATNDTADIADADADWHDVTLVLTNGSVSSFTSDGSLTRHAPFPWGRLRVKCVTTNATNALKLYLTRGRVNAQSSI